jgi:hypothetical protein
VLKGAAPSYLPRGAPVPECRITDIITAQRLKDTTLLGVDLTLDDGTAYPDAQYTQAIHHAIATVENELGLTIDQFTVEGENHDIYAPDRSAWWPFRMDERPIRKVTGMRIRYGSFPPVEFPLSWIKMTSHMFGQLHIMPSEEALGSYIIRAGIPFVAGDVMQAMDWIPGYFEFDYECGFVCHNGTLVIPDGETEATYTFPTDVPMTDRYRTDLALTDAQGAAGLRLKKRSLKAFTVEVTTPPAGADATVTWTADSIPDDIKQLILIIAAMMPLAVAGDLIVGAGIASISTSMDGLSQNINTTSSATNSGYGARILELRKQADALLPAIRARFRMPGFAAI